MTDKYQWHYGCPANETYVKQNGVTVKRSKNLRGLLDYAQKAKPVLIETRKDSSAPAAGNLRVTYSDGAIGHAFFRSHGIMLEWVGNRRSWASVKKVHLHGLIGT